MTLLSSPAIHGPAGKSGAPDSSGAPEGTWVDVCGLDRLTEERGAAALVGERPVALFRLDHDEVVAIDDVDPMWGVAVLSRGLVGHVAGHDTVASPLLKQRFDLRTGACLDDAALSVCTWPVRVRLGRIEVGRRPSTGAS